MGDAETTPRAWPFLVARGRQRGYRTLLAPGFLVADRDYGVLDDSIVPGDAYDRASVTEVVTGTGRALTVVHATHPVTAADVAGPGAEPGAEPRDRHSRPLRLIYGFVCAAGDVGEPDAGDLAACRAAALGVYRRFLDDEDGFTVESSTGFTPRTSLGTGRPAAPRSAPPPAAGRHREDEGRRPAHASLLILGVVLLVAIALTLVWLTSHRPRPPEVCPTPSVSAGPLLDPSPSACPPERPAG
jgi:hypothetical protein